MKSSLFSKVLLSIAIFISGTAASQNNLPQTKNFSPAASARTVQFDKDWLFVKESSINANGVGGTGWNRKHFVTPQTARNKQSYIYFDGGVHE